MSNLKDFISELKDTVIDFSELNVRTFEGNIKTALGTGGAVITDDLGNLDELLRKGVVSGELNLMASTVYKLDKDVDQFFDTNITNEMKEEHQAVVKASKEARAALLNALIDKL